MDCAAEQNGRRVVGLFITLLNRRRDADADSSGGKTDGESIRQLSAPAASAIRLPDTDEVPREREPLRIVRYTFICFDTSSPYGEAESVVS